MAGGSVTLLDRRGRPSSEEGKTTRLKVLAKLKPSLFANEIRELAQEAFPGEPHCRCTNDVRVKAGLVELIESIYQGFRGFLFEEDSGHVRFYDLRSASAP